MKSMKAFAYLLLAFVTAFGMTVPSAAQERERTTTTQTPAQEKEKTTTTQDPAQPSATSNKGQTQDEARANKVEAGRKQKISGTIVKRDPDSFVMSDMNGAEVTVKLNDSTEVKEKKSNPFRRAKNYGATSLLRGLSVEVEGRGDDSGAIVAEDIKFTDAEYRVARSIETRVTPVEGRMGEAETRLTQSEQNAQRIAGQLEELAAVANTARGGAKAAQETADSALKAATTAQQTADTALTKVTETNNRISALDDFEARKNATVNFKVRSAVLSPEAKATLDEIATQAKNETGFVIQVTGFASADGNERSNRELSERRADAVVRYLIENHDIPIRRIITPFGYGELKPAGDNATREGREQNRRVEVAILVSKGLADATAETTPPPSAGAERSQSTVPPRN